MDDVRREPAPLIQRGSELLLWMLMAPGWVRRVSKYMPHQGAKEMARRRRQIERGVLRAGNRGVTCDEES